MDGTKAATRALPAVQAGGMMGVLLSWGDLLEDG